MSARVLRQVLWCVVLAGAGFGHAAAFDRPEGWDNPLSVPVLGEDGVPAAADGGVLICTDVGLPAGPLSLSAAMNLAFCRNPRVLSEWSTVQVQASAVGEARSAYLPKVSLSVSQLVNKTRYPDGNAADEQASGTTRYANLSWRVFDFGSREAGLTSTQQLLRAALASRNATLQKLMSALAGAYFDAVTAQAVHQARQQAARLAQATLEATVRREERGVAAGMDVLQARAALAKAALASERAHGDARKAAAVLTYTMGVPGAVALTLPSAMDAPSDAEVQDLAHWLTEAQARHPAIVAAQAQWDAARAKVVAVRAEGLPSVDFSVSAYANGYPNQGLSSVRSQVTTVGLALSMPLFEGFGRTYKVRGAQAQAAQSEASLQDVALQVSMDVVKAHADASASAANAQAAQTWVQAAEAAVQSATRRYDKRAGDMLELLSTQGAQADAHQERIRCLADWHAARLKLLSAAGVLRVVDDR